MKHNMSTYQPTKETKSADAPSQGSRVYFLELVKSSVCSFIAQYTLQTRTLVVTVAHCCRLSQMVLAVQISRSQI